RDTAQVSMIVKTIEAYLVTYRQNYIIKQTTDAAEANKGRNQMQLTKEYNPVRVGEKEKSLDLAPGAQSSSVALASSAGTQTPLQTLSNNVPIGKVINL